jgi:hypothetical protein
MFKVDVDSMAAYFDFDPGRRIELEELDALIRTSAPRLTPYFHRGTPTGEPGMRFKMIGYGSFEYAAKSGKTVLWPLIGVALQKNYISVYFAVTRQGKPVTEGYQGRLGAVRSGEGNFSFNRFSDLDRGRLSELVSETQHLFEDDPESLSNFDRPH